MRSTFVYNSYNYNYTFEATENSHGLCHTLGPQQILRLVLRERGEHELQKFQELCKDTSLLSPFILMMLLLWNDMKCRKSSVR